MKKIRKWSRILHRDIGFFFVGATIIYGISGIALNHLSDWDPNYKVVIKNIDTKLNLKKTEHLKENILKLLDETNDRKNYKKHYYPNKNELKIFIKDGTAVINTETGKGMIEYIKKRHVFYQTVLLHYNPQRWWTWFSDIFAGALIILAVTSLFMIKGKKGAWGRGSIYIVLGIIIPILFLIFL